MGPQQGLANRCDGIIHCRDVMWSHFEEIFVISCTGSWQMKTSGATNDTNFLKMALLVSMHVARIYSPSLNMSMFNFWNVYCDVVCIIVLKLTVLWWDPIPANIYVLNHDDVIKWKHFPRYWPFVRGIHRSPVNSPHKGQWRGALMFSLICAWISGWANNREAGDFETPSRPLWRHCNVVLRLPERTMRDVLYVR